MNLFDSTGFVRKEVFSVLEKKLINNKSSNNTIIQTIAELIRFNTLLSVSRAGTGHLGASLSMVELLAEIYFRSFSFDAKKKKAKNRDIFILSKGHGAPAVYATLAAKSYFPTKLLNRLRRWGGLEGHCDIVTEGVEANTGSLAMGLSKAVGYAIAKKRFKLGGNVVVVVGDGELQEGQCWEAFLSAVNFNCDNLFIVIDDNKVQTDQYTSHIVKYGDLPKTFSAIGFYVSEGKGTKVKDIHKAFGVLKKKTGKPKLLYLHTKKGQGISFMEHTNVLRKSSERYIWHNKAPNGEQLQIALREVIYRVDKALKRNAIKFPSPRESPLRLRSGQAFGHSRGGFSADLSISLTNIPVEPMQQGIEGKSLIAGFANSLEKLAQKNKKIVVVDGDLEEDCGFIPFHQSFPKRFFEMGIMEQHMIGTVCALSRLGYIPIVASYAAFLTARANEQLYNLATENARAIIIGNMAGILPATPGKSHQAFRDISCMKNIPGFSLYQPISAQDAAQVVERYLQGGLGELLYIRLSMAPGRIEVPTPSKQLAIGLPHKMKDGKDALIVGIGPVVLGECLTAAKVLEKEEIHVSVWNHPWITEISTKDYETKLREGIPLVVVEDHYYKGGFGESLLAHLATIGLRVRPLHMAMRDFPQTGFRQEALEGFGLDYLTIAAKIRTFLRNA